MRCRTRKNGGGKEREGESRAHHFSSRELDRSSSSSASSPASRSICLVSSTTAGKEQEQDLDRLLPVEDAGLLGEADGFGLVLGADEGEVMGEARLEAEEDVLEEGVEEEERLVVVLADRHLQVQPRELAQVPPRVGLLRPEHRAHLKDAAQVARDGHLLVELRRLREAGGATEVVGAEDLGPALALPRDQLRRVDLEEPLLVQLLPE
eukprot:88757-Hanusia_phi.AAC.4